MFPRRYPLLELSLGKIQKLVEPAFPGDKVISAELIKEGGINTNYMIRTAGSRDPRALRIFMRGDECWGREVALLKKVTPGVPVPQVYYAEPASRRFQYPFLVASWLPGSTLDEALATASDEDQEELGRKVGATLAAIGKLRFKIFGMLRPDLTVEPWDNSEPERRESPAGEVSVRKDDQLSTALQFIKMFLAQRAGKHLGPALSARVMNVARQNSGLFEHAGDAHLVHSDFNPTNILVARSDKGWCVSGVLDWEWAHAGTPLFDIAILLRQDEIAREPFKRGFVVGFPDEGGRLPEDWRERTLLLDLLNLLEMINTTDHLFPRQKEMVQRISETVERFEG